MAQKGKVTKTEIFCLGLTVLFLLVTAVAFFGGGSRGGAVEIVTWKDTDTEEALPQKIDINAADETELRELTNSAISKLNRMTDAEYDALDLIPDFTEEDMDAE